MQINSALFSIRPQHAENIFCGKKTVELRRTRPKKLRVGSVVMVYVSSPQKALRGAFSVAGVIQKPISELWELVKDKAHLSQREFEEYFASTSEGVAIFIGKVWYLQEPIKLKELREMINNFRPPQSFRYTKKGEIKIPIMYCKKSQSGD